MDTQDLEKAIQEKIMSTQELVKVAEDFERGDTLTITLRNRYKDLYRLSKLIGTSLDLVGRHPYEFMSEEDMLVKDPPKSFVVQVTRRFDLEAFVNQLDGSIKKIKVS